MTKSIASIAALVAIPALAAPLGIFEGHGDVGTVLHAGSVEYDGGKHTYTVSGSGENMWFASDAFQFAWQKVSGDVTLTADISFLGAGKEGHRKAVLTIRQSLDADSPYADVARHGDGLTSLQAREEKGVNTTEIQSAVKGPTRVRIARRGDFFYIWVAGAGEQLQFSGGAMRIPMHDPVYVGIGVCSHNKDVVEQAVFSNVELTRDPASKAPPTLYSTIETVPLSGDRRVTYAAPGRLTAATFSPDGSTVFFNRGASSEHVALAGGTPLPTQGMFYSGPPNGSSEPTEQPLDPSLLTDNYRNILAQFSPDGQQMAFLSFAKDTTGIPEDKEVLLRVINRKDGKVKTLAKFIGGPGSAPSWSSDGRRLAFVSYQWLR